MWLSVLKIRTVIFMYQQDFLPARRGISLSVKVSIALVLAAIVPLILTLSFSEFQTRPQLITQANNAMAGDAKTRVQLIDTYFHERLLDTQTITQVPSVQQFVASPPTTPGYQILALHAQYGLSAGTFRDKNYTTWSLFDPKGDLLLSYPSAPKRHGQFLVAPQYLQKVDKGGNFVSAVYYTPATKKTSVDIYAPMIATLTPEGTPLPKPIYLGFLRATLNLDYILNIINTDHDNGSGSYAFVLDENGVRIADPLSDQLFKSVAPLSASAKQQISQEARFGTTNAPGILADSTLATKVNTTSISNFQMQPTGQKESFEVVNDPTDPTIIPWHYFVLSPVNTVTSVANQQLLVTIIVAAAMSTLVAVLGLIVGRNITRPILRSVENLRSNSRALSSLAARQRDAASEQMWVVDSSQVGLQSVQYYTDATKVAAQRLTETGFDLLQRRQQAEPATTKKSLEHIITASRYIEDASQHQTASIQKLSTALKVATQVTEQLASGATSATDAATQMEQVVQQLRSVVGQ
jgi:methyl-accepting chemotaxis protein